MTKAQREFFEEDEVEDDDVPVAIVGRADVMVLKGAEAVVGCCSCEWMFAANFLAPTRSLALWRVVVRRVMGLWLHTRSILAVVMWLMSKRTCVDVNVGVAVRWLD